MQKIRLHHAQFAAIFFTFNFILSKYAKASICGILIGCYLGQHKGNYQCNYCVPVVPLCSRLTGNVTVAQ